mmetsp:Transcript_76152/g.221110  ORF Transcript_76152/g.221110 Transcript_76152/m.221110 type:complete len:248 (+) Transcript_76152:452-1195(+)
MAVRSLQHDSPLFIAGQLHPPQSMDALIPHVRRQVEQVCQTPDGGQLGVPDHQDGVHLPEVVACVDENGGLGEKATQREPAVQHGDRRYGDVEAREQRPEELREVCVVGLLHRLPQPCCSRGSQPRHEAVVDDPALPELVDKTVVLTDIIHEVGRLQFAHVKLLAKHRELMATHIRVYREQDRHAEQYAEAPRALPEAEDRCDHHPAENAGQVGQRHEAICGVPAVGNDPFLDVGDTDCASRLLVVG